MRCWNYRLAVHFSGKPSDGTAICSFDSCPGTALPVLLLKIGFIDDSSFQLSGHHTWHDVHDRWRSKTKTFELYFAT